MANDRSNPAAWATLLCRLAEPVLADTPLVGGEADEAVTFIDAFRDEQGHRREIDRPVLMHLLGARGAYAPLDPVSPDVALWRGITDGVSGDAALSRMLTRRDGPLTEFAPDLAIEIWTETELACLHALSHYADRPAVNERLRAAARWHVAELQPDNATNHPWASHVFVAAWIERGDAEARLHAETLIENARVATGHPDRFSACLMLDSARWLERHAPRSGADLGSA
ncbi:MAG: hypothetical protein CMJ31_03590 [Phycisphaerae bacterium]|nr:hypothetical protein [Phycisphaerae bacterium]